MLIRPSSCGGCSLNIPSSTGFMKTEGFPELGVTLMGEALGESEAERGLPFQGTAGIRLGKMIENAGYKREQFLVTNAVWCRPVNNTEPPTQAIEHCKRHWEAGISSTTKVLVPMGNVPLFATTGGEGILSRRGYVKWSEKYQCYILPTVHPSFIMRGNSNWEAAFLYDLRHAVDIAKDGWSSIDSQRDYTLDAGIGATRNWVDQFKAELRSNPLNPVAADLETPDKNAAEDETDINLGYLPGPIHRCGFAYVARDGRTKVVSMPWDVNHLPFIKEILESVAPKIFCYRHFDVPRIRAHQVLIKGAIHDIQEAWHCLHSDLPKSLEHITPYLCPRQPAWKHLNTGGTQAYYNGVDCAVTVEGWHRVKALLTSAGMWNLYWRDIHQLNEILIYMSEQGMPIDSVKRMEASKQLGELRVSCLEKMNEAASLARPTKTYSQARFSEGLQEIEVEKEENYCTECDKRVPGVGQKHPHFKCGTAPGELPLGTLGKRHVKVKAWIKPLDFKPSQKGLIRYALFKGYKLITRWDRDTQTRKSSMDENNIRKYALKHVEDPLFPLVLEYRELDKLLGTYVGRLTDEPEKVRTGQDLWWEQFRALPYKVVENAAPKDRRPEHVTPVNYEDDDIPF